MAHRFPSADAPGSPRSGGRAPGSGRADEDRDEIRAQLADAILDDLIEALLAFDREGRCLYLNREAERVLGSSRKEVVGRVPDASPVLSVLREACQRALAEQVAVEVAAFGVTEGRWYEARACPAQGGVVVLVREVTRAGRPAAHGQRSSDRGVARAARELAGARRAGDAGADRPAQRDDLSARDLLARLSHELRNPLAAIRNTAELLRRSRRPEDNRHGDRLARQAEAIRSLLEGVLDEVGLGGARLKGGSDPPPDPPPGDPAVETEGGLAARKRASSGGSSPPGEPGQQRRRVLVVDDNLDSAETMAELVKIWGHEVRTAHDGPGALETARTFRPQVVLLDVGLPGMDGYELARRLRKEGLAGDLLVSVTGYGQEEDRRRAAEAGFDHHLTKPVDPDILLKLVSS